MNVAPTDPLPPALARFAPLRRAELLLLRACASGEIAKVGLRLPEAATAELSVRASLLSHVLRGGLSLRGRRLQLVGAAIEGRLDLGGAAIAGSLWFYRCRFDAPVLLDGARIGGSVTFAGCVMDGLLAEGADIAADLVLNAGTRVAQELRLARLRIGGRLDGSRLDLSGGSGATSARRALLADGLWVGGDVLLTEDFQSIGELRFTGARIGGDLCIAGLVTGNALPEGGRAPALVLDRLQLEGSLRLDGGFGAAGCVSLRRARIAGDLDASGASFDWLGDGGWGEQASLVLERARIEGRLVLRALRTPLLGASFVGARVGTLADDQATWGERIALDGFDYSRLDEDAPLDTVFRIDWLERQPSAHLQSQFRLQPWQRLIEVLRRMGHGRRAGRIAQRRERWLRHIGRVAEGMPRGLRWLPNTGHRLLGLLAGHGHRPGRLLAWLVAVWLACGGLYAAAAALAPAAAPPGFSPLAHSLDRLLPLLRLDLAGTWRGGPPWVDALRWLGHAESVFGLAALGLLLASLAGWLERDRHR